MLRTRRLVARRVAMPRVFTRRVTATLVTALFLLLGPQVLAAQVDTTTRRDTVQVDSARLADSLRIASLRADSLRADSLRAEAIRRRAERLADTIKAPLVLPPAGASIEAIRPLRWTREELLATGAMNLADLLDAVPGVATFRTSWLPGVHAAAFQGDFRRVRLFLDGVELDAPDARHGGVLDLTDVNLIALDEVVVERAAGEVRVWLTSWTVRSVTPYTRTDIYTGDLNTNGFRGMFGRRFMNGALLQVTLQQGETTRQRGTASPGGFTPAARGIAGDGDVQHLTARLGWARGLFSVDGYLLNARRNRDSTGADPAEWALPAFSGSRRDVQLRLGYGSPVRGWQARAVLGTVRTGLDRGEDEEGLVPAPLPQPVPGEEEEPELPEAVDDSTRSGRQQLVQVGYAWDRARAMAFGRWRTVAGRREFAPGVQLSADRGWLSGAAHAERLGLDSSVRVDASLRVALRPWLVGTVAHSELRPDEETGRIGERTSRVEGALRLSGRWLSAGLVRQAFDPAERGVVVPRVLTPYLADSVPRLLGFSGTGVTAGAYAPLYKDLRLELHGMRWNGTREYRPQTHVRASFILQSEWRSRFPKGDFGINARFTHEYRSGVSFLDPDATGTSVGFRQTEPYQLGIALLEIRIQRATIFYQFRNAYGAQYAQVPGVPMPPPFQIYGVRWEWFN
jgi:hypothetical protein